MLCNNISYRPINGLTKFFESVLLISCLVLSSACAAESQRLADQSTEANNAYEIIWSKELAIYKARERGDLGYYIANSSERYFGWPPGWPAPSNLDKLRAGAKQMKGMNGERLTMTFSEFTLSGSTAVIYYSTHRTSDPTGKKVDQHFEVSHVWTLENDEWKLLGSMGRIKPEPFDPTAKKP